MKKTLHLLILALACPLFSLVGQTARPSGTTSGPIKEYYMSTSFHEPADEGLRYLYSRDGVHWDSIPGTWLAPTLGDSIMRDPSMWRGPDGTYHLVWTIAWRKDTGFGYASSKDLIHWTPAKRIPAMDNVEGTYCVWAPELFYDDVKQQYLIIYSSQVNDGTSRGIREEHGDYHRMYYVATRDFETFSEPKLFYDPGYSCIDGVVWKRGTNDYVLVAKDNRKANSNLRVAFAQQAEGPYTPLSKPFSVIFSEGPSVAQIGDTYYIYYDVYRQGIYGTTTTKDFVHFSNATHKVKFPKLHKHGTVFTAPAELVEGLLQQSRHK